MHSLRIAIEMRRSRVSGSLDPSVLYWLTVNIVRNHSKFVCSLLNLDNNNSSQITILFCDIEHISLAILLKICCSFEFCYFVCARYCALGDIHMRAPNDVGDVGAQKDLWPE